MPQLYIAIGYFHVGTDTARRTVLGIFRNKADAEQFRDDENNEVGADMVSIEAIPLVDRYGFPISPTQWVRAKIRGGDFSDLPGGDTRK